MLVLGFSWVSHVEELETPCSSFGSVISVSWENETSDDPVYPVNGKSGCYISYILSLFLPLLVDCLAKVDPLDQNGSRQGARAAQEHCSSQKLSTIYLSFARPVEQVCSGRAKYIQTSRASDHQQDSIHEYIQTGRARWLGASVAKFHILSNFWSFWCWTLWWLDWSSEIRSSRTKWAAVAFEIFLSIVRGPITFVDSNCYCQDCQPPYSIR